ncbi:acyltransferase [Craterilacuibacter sp.]|uniref:acyltransferase n=1 Tax=Craterilacuibacter sp. TaxID=2870909 RepID=UPI003F370D2B
MKLWDRLRFRLSGLIGPRMLAGFTRADGVFLRRVRISNMTRIEHPHKLQLEDNIFIGHFNMVDASGGLYISEGCQITNHVSLLTHSSHDTLRLYGAGYLDHHNHVGYLKKPSLIGAYSFIGPHSVLMPGVRLGKGTLVSAYAQVASGDYPDFAILAGNPARIVGDTRERDAPFLAAHPELKPLYEAWAHES